VYVKKINKAYMMLGIIKRNFALSQKCQTEFHEIFT